MKLHLGCGKRYIPGFVHIDAVPYGHVDHVSSIDNLSFLSDESVDLIYNCHVLEHFKRAEVSRVLNEWKRVLRKGGMLRTSVPDFGAICEIYQTSQNLNDVIGPLFGRQDYLYNIHYNAFDFGSISSLLKEAGFREIAKYDWRNKDHADIDDYSQAYFPHMDKTNGIQVSLNIECLK